MGKLEKGNSLHDFCTSSLSLKLFENKVRSSSSRWVDGQLHPSHAVTRALGAGPTWGLQPSCCVSTLKRPPSLQDRPPGLAGDTHPCCSQRPAGLCAVARSRRTRRAPCQTPRPLWGQGVPSASPGAQATRLLPHSRPAPPPRATPPVPAVPLALGLVRDAPQGSEKAGAGAQGSEAGGPPTGAPPA